MTIMLLLVSVFSAKSQQNINFGKITYNNAINIAGKQRMLSQKMAKATELVKAQRPNLMVDGEMQADIALQKGTLKSYPFSALKRAANVLIFPNLGAGNIAYKLLAANGSEVIGPLVLGLDAPVNVLQQDADAETIVHMMSLTVARIGLDRR